MDKQIQLALQKVETEYQCRILFAGESGSRAWGFASKDSDFDIRLVYMHSAKWYLQLQKRADTIDLMLPGDLDLCGWDLRKALRLFAGCNMALNEWLGSPIVYQSNRGFKDALIALLPQYFNPKKALYHYLAMAKKAGEGLATAPEISIKKLFYVFRTLFACRWIVTYQTMPPTIFKEILLDNALASQSIQAEIKDLLLKKYESREGAKIDCSKALSLWIAQTIVEMEQQATNIATCKAPGWNTLNSLMAELVGWPDLV